MSACEELALLVKKYIEVQMHYCGLEIFGNYAIVEPEVAKSMLEKAEEILCQTKRS